MNDIKQQIMDAIMASPYVPVFIKVNPIQFRIRCPICGDSQKNPKDAHCYIKCSYDPSEPIMFNCFKCNSNGRVTKSFLDKLHINPDLISKLDNQRYNKISSIKKNNIEIITGSPIIDSSQVRYIEKRLGTGFSIEDYDRFKIVWDMSNIFQYIADKRTRNSIPSNIDSVSFISDDKSTLLTRSFYDDGDRWRKIKLFPSEDKSFYTIKATLDLFTSDPIVVNIAEGVFDVLSVYKNFNDGQNSVYIAILGSDYASGIDYAIRKGFIGNNIVIKLYIDSDVNERQLKYQLKKYKWLFKQIIILKNIKQKDVGYKIEDIKLIEDRI